MESAAFSDAELLKILKEFCTEENCFRGATPDGQARDFYNETMKMAEEELKKKPRPDPDKVQTVVSNMLTVIGNAAAYFDDASKDHKKDMITFEVTEVDSSKVCRFLDESTKITARYEAAEARKGNMERIDALRRRKAVRILQSVLLLLIAIGFLIFLSGYLISDKPSQTESGGFFERIALWYKYDVRKEAVPVTFAEKWIRFSGNMGVIAALANVIWILQELGTQFLQFLLWRKNRPIRREWRDYQTLCRAFEAASAQMNELEW